VQPSTLRDYDERDMFCLFLLPGNNENRKVVALIWVSPWCHSTMSKIIVNLVTKKKKKISLGKRFLQVE
jgi:hypothetical protein